MSRLITHASLLVTVRRLSVSVFVASTLLLVACGGGSSSGTDNSRLDGKSPYTDKPSDDNNTGGDGNSNDGAADDDASQDPSTDTPDGNAGTDPDDTGNDTGSDNVTDGGDDTPDANEPGSDDPVVDDGSDAEPDPVVNEPDAGDDSDLIEDVVSEVSGAVRLVWDRPERRENGEFLEGDEIGGYELRYRRLGEEDVKTVIINDGWDEDYELGELVGSYQFSIAAFDNNGLYSEFVSLSPATGLVGSL